MIALLLFQAADVIGVLEKASAPIKDVTIEERGAIGVSDMGDMLEVEFRTRYVRGASARVDAFAAMDPVRLEAMIPPVEVFITLVESPDVCFTRIWASNIPPIAKGYLVPYFETRVKRQGDPLALPPEVPARFVFDRLLLWATLEPRRWIPDSAEARQEGERWTLTARTPMKDLLPEGTLVRGLPVGDLTRRFFVDSGRLTGLDVEFTVVGERFVLCMEHRAESWREAAGVSFPSRVRVEWVGDDIGRRSVGPYFTTEIGRLEANTGGPADPIPAGRGLDPVLKPAAEYAADGYNRAFARLKEIVLGAVKARREPAPIAPDLVADLAEAVRQDPANPASAIAYLELHSKLKDAELKDSIVKSAGSEAALLLAERLKPEEAQPIVEKALAAERNPALRRRLQATAVALLADAEKPDAAAASLGAALQDLPSFADARALGNALARAKLALRVKDDPMEAALAKAPPGDGRIHYVRSLAAERGSERWADAVARMVEDGPPEALAIAEDQVWKVLFDAPIMFFIPTPGKALPGLQALAGRMDPADPYSQLLLSRTVEAGPERERYRERTLELLEKAGARPGGWTRRRASMLLYLVDAEEVQEPTKTLERTAKLALSCAAAGENLLSRRLQYSGPVAQYGEALAREGDVEGLLELIQQPGFASFAPYGYGIWQPAQESGAQARLMTAAGEALESGKLSRTGCENLVSGTRYFLQNSAESLQFMEAAVRRHPESPALWLAAASQRESEADKVEAYKKAIELVEKGGTAGAELHQGINEARLQVALHMKAADPAEAKRLLKEIDFSSGWESQTFQGAVDLFLELGMAEDALALFSGPLVPTDYLALDHARVLEAAGKILEAARAYRRAADHERQNPRAYRRFRNGNVEEGSAQWEAEEFAKRFDRARLLELLVALPREKLADAEREKAAGLFKQWREDDEARRNAATTGLRAMGPKLVPLITPLLKDQDPEVRARAESLLEGWVYEDR